MSEPLLVAANPCESCPYRRDVPPGIWDRSEYKKLPQFDDGPNGQQSFAVFLCHHSPDMTKDAACRGWLSVHCESVAVRLAMMSGKVTPAQVYAPVSTPLYATGAEACAAGIKGIRRPNKQAKKIAQRLVSKQRKRARRG